MERTLADAIGGTVRQRTVRELRDRILTGRLPDGARLDLDRISSEFGVSRTPVREAILELSFQGLVEIAPRSSVTVIGVTPDQTLDNFAILAALSGKAAEWAANRISPEALAELSANAETLASATRSEESVAANWRYHRTVNEAAGSRQLMILIRQAVRLIPSNYLTVISVHDADEHEQLLAHLRMREATAARILAERHVLSVGESLAAWLSAQSEALKPEASKIG